MNHDLDRLDLLRAGALAGTVRLSLQAGLREFPPEIYALADTLEILDLSGNALSELPAELPRLHRLRILFCSDNRFTELPEVLGRCAQLEMIGFKANRIGRVAAAALPPRLRWLILTDNEIETLPDELGRCERLQKLALAGNRLSALPATLARCRRLELLRISANRFTALPDWLATLPRLSWLAFGGNPLGEAAEQQALSASPLPAIPWPTLQIGPRLGEGASGVIYQARPLAGAERNADPGTDTPELALKVFKGAVTSDGWPHSEMAAALRAGSHAGLIALRGRLSEHPQRAMGLAMVRIAPRFRSLAAPPSLASCTRDVYADDARFAPQLLLRLAQRMAAALAHLHRQGILHGDFYAHNILHDDDGQAYLADFGAASFLAPSADAQGGESASASAWALALQRLEVRAFGCLLEELLARCTAPLPPEARPPLAGLHELARACLGEVPQQRPLFDAIEQRLSALAGA
ncbi:MAG: leucine-rich repeat-containing protein kinase family protein [Burkholderiaceae bacterium]